MAIGLLAKESRTEMVREIVHDPLILARKSVEATVEDLLTLKWVFLLSDDLRGHPIKIDYTKEKLLPVAGVFFLKNTKKWDKTPPNLQW